ncbi:cholesterol esterase [Actinomadura harenae]|uniref:Cholesterol esterase n=2 Tax=Actinomadura harenae TaxID=2483351 RepID=A0A3M2LVQ0_9ACTN|nr:cholesterol esterase [Actinomadura harenae]
MSDSSEAALGKVRWKRFAALAAPAAVGAGALVFMTAQGALASSFAVSGGSFKVHADSLDGTGFVQYGGADAEKNGTKHLVQISGIKNAKITNMCQSVKVLPGVVLRLTAGDAGKPVEATDLTLDVEQLDADAEFRNIEIGRDASTMDKNTQALGRAGEGMFGQQADEVHLKNVRQVAWATTAGTFKLNHLSMKLGNECF